MFGESQNQQPMFSMIWPAKNKPKERFYLLPGMGGRALRRKRKLMLQAAIAAGLFVSVILAGILYWINRR
jgi:hypothetical protein